jgi:hypothetical protein
VLVLLAGLRPACEPQAVETGRILDDALLLALAAHE